LCIKLVEFAKYTTFDQLMVIGKTLFMIVDLKEYISRVEELLGLEHCFIPKNKKSFLYSKQNMSSFFKDAIESYDSAYCVI